MLRARIEGVVGSGGGHGCPDGRRRVPFRLRRCTSEQPWEAPEVAGSRAEMHAPSGAMRLLAAIVAAGLRLLGATWRLRAISVQILR